MARIEAFFKLMAEPKASDLHLSTNNPPMLRMNEIWFAWIIPGCKMTISRLAYEIAHDVAAH